VPRSQTGAALPLPYVPCTNDQAQPAQAQVVGLQIGGAFRSHLGQAWGGYKGGGVQLPSGSAAP